MPTGTVRHFFPGGNTPQGFVSYYDYVISQDARRIFILKGGPGTGKSTFMKRISLEMNQAGFATEHHHCSSDNNSLDGVVIPALQVAFIDGTAPHVVDPKNPGCVDEILNLGSFWDESGIAAHKSAIINCNAKIKACFQRAYRLLRAARAVYDDWAAINTAALDMSQANIIAEEIIDKILSGITTAGCGKTRKLFASAITPNGAVNYLESLASHTANHYIITGLPGTGKSTIVQKIAAAVNAKGLDIEIFYCPFDPQKPEHLVIPALGVSVITSTEPHTFSSAAGYTISMDECLNQTVLEAHAEIAADNQKTYQALFAKAIASIQQAKKLHDELETYYIPYMDFKRIDDLWKKTLERVFAYAK